MTRLGTVRELLRTRSRTSFAGSYSITGGPTSTSRRGAGASGRGTGARQHDFLALGPTASFPPLCLRPGVGRERQGNQRVQRSRGSLGESAGVFSWGGLLGTPLRLRTSPETPQVLRGRTSRRA